MKKPKQGRGTGRARGRTPIYRVKFVEDEDATFEECNGESRPLTEVESLDRRGAVSAYVQTDPRGAALYILRPEDVPEGQDVGSYYTRGICVY